jgi:nucleoside-diphosphate-sugar epimerase
MTARRVLVTGAAGFIGRWSVPPLASGGYEVHAVTHGTPRELPPQLRDVEMHVADLLDAAAVDRLMTAVKPTHLLHFAWIATPGVYWTSPDNYRWLAASRHLLQSFRSRGGERAVMAGTCAEYDWSQVAVCHELDSPLADGRLAEGAARAEGEGAVMPYAECKLALYRALVEFGDAGLSTAWGRIFFQYGPGEHPDRLVASVIRHLLSAREAPCSHGRQIRDFLHVADVGAAFAALLDSAVTGPVNIGSGNGIALAELLGEVAGQIGRPDLLRMGARASAPGEPAILVADVTRLRDEVGWRPRVTPADGIRDAIEWWRARQP